MTVCLVLSCVLFGVAREIMSPQNIMSYWVLKLLAIYLALVVSIVLTVFWEEWVVWRLSRSPAGEVSFVQPVIRANLIVLLAVMVVSAGVMIPQRLKNPGFIVPEKRSAALRKNSPIIKYPASLPKSVR